MSASAAQTCPWLNAQRIDSECQAAIISSSICPNQHATSLSLESLRLQTSMNACAIASGHHHHAAEAMLIAPDAAVSEVTSSPLSRSAITVSSSSLLMLGSRPATWSAVPCTLAATRGAVPGCLPAEAAGAVSSGAVPCCPWWCRRTYCGCCGCCWRDWRVPGYDAEPSGCSMQGASVTSACAQSPCGRCWAAPCCGPAAMDAHWPAAGASFAGDAPASCGADAGPRLGYSASVIIVGLPMLSLRAA